MPPAGSWGSTLIEEEVAVVLFPLALAWFVPLEDAVPDEDAEPLDEAVGFDVIVPLPD